MIDTQIIQGELPPIELSDNLRQDGAELIFHGRVRELEDGEPIAALRYEYYPRMAERVLRELAEHTVSRFALSDLICHHLVGDVQVGRASLRVVMRSAHRAEALSAMAWFVSELKNVVPIWKWAVFADGQVLPCGPCTGCQHEEKQDGHAASDSP